MNTLFFEIYQEEVPARMQAAAETQLAKLIETYFCGLNVSFKVEEVVSTPRRLAAHITDLPYKQPDEAVETRGPKVDAPDKAVAGFLNANNITREDCEVRETPKGTFLFYTKHVLGLSLEHMAEQLLEYVLQNFSWPKSMKWDQADFKWVRPVRQLILSLNGEPLVGKNIMGIPLRNSTLGHRVLDGDQVIVSDFASYKETLNNHKVLFRPQRRAKILKELGALLAEHNASNTVPEYLLDEVVGLTEYPVVLEGHIPIQYMELPQELLVSAMEQQQRYFPIYNPSGCLLPMFGFAANNLASHLDDNASEVISGNEKVLDARLSDGSFYWEEDQSRPLYSEEGDCYYNRLAQAHYHKGLGTLQQKADRLAALGKAINEELSACAPAEVELAARMCKGDLTSGVVSEFPNLQGLIGSYLAQHEKADPIVAKAISEHYKPQGVDDILPVSLLGVVLALADKVDTLVGFYLVDEKPTGSRDPYSLRRAALGLLRILQEYKFDITLDVMIRAALTVYKNQLELTSNTLQEELLAFIYTRFEQMQKDAGMPVELVRAVTHKSLKGITVYEAMMNTRHVQAFLASPEGAQVLGVVKRCRNILPGAFSANANALKQATDEKDKECLKVIQNLASTLDNAETVQEDLQQFVPAARFMEGYLEVTTIMAEDDKTKNTRLNMVHQFYALFNEIVKIEYLNLG